MSRRTAIKLATMLVVVIGVACGIALGQNLHRINKPTKIEGWLQTQGDVWSLWPDKYDIGKRAYWWDSGFVADVEVRSILVWSVDSTETTYITPTSILGGGAMTRSDILDTIDLDTVMVSENWRFKDTVFTDYIFGDDNSAPQVGPDGTSQMDSSQIGGGDVVIKWVVIGSHFAIILSGDDTLWAAADTSTF